MQDRFIEALAIRRVAGFAGPSLAADLVGEHDRVSDLYPSFEHKGVYRFATSSLAILTHSTAFSGRLPRVWLSFMMISRQPPRAISMARRK